MLSRNHSISCCILLAALPFEKLLLPLGHSLLDPIVRHDLHQGDTTLALLA